ncbi:hypothetical protein P4E94_09745 [Pontiellaceae bacterium B12219]|nr:hypothetical protein [Pontiellaceae bacterium B12219]
MKTTQRNKRKSGQVMLEYVIAFGIFLTLIGLSALLLYSFKVYGGRIITIMSAA